ncbi:MAG: D-arabinono-1,4-lactone oxidase [Calothrix sp. MO_167.B42]|nr:D-arabinono-1,4-lactone oxidase [Calothrix sp. MO_167.B42]
MKSEQEIDKLLEAIPTVSTDQIGEIDHKLAEFICEVDTESIPSFMKKFSSALSENTSLQDLPSENVSLQDVLSNSSKTVGTIELPLSSGETSNSWIKNKNRRFGNNFKRVHPKYYAYPKTLDDIIALVKSTPAESSIDVYSTGLSPNALFDKSAERLMLIKGMKCPLDFETYKDKDEEKSIYRNDPKAHHYHRTQAGVSLEDFMDHLNNRGLALNFAGYTPQSLFGAATTSTHKSGFLPPLSDLVLSIDVVLGDGEVHRIEPSDGITNPDIFIKKYPNRKLIQDDEIFYSIFVIGNVGIVYSIIVQAESRYSLKLTKKYYPNIDDASEEIENILKNQCQNKEQDNEPWQLDIWVIPKTAQAMLIIHEKVKPAENIQLLPRKSGGIWYLIDEIFLEIGLPVSLLDTIFYKFPQFVEQILQRFFPKQEAETTPLDWRDFLGDSLPRFAMMASETIIDYNGDSDNFDRHFLNIIKKIAEQTNHLYYSSAMGIRFVRKSNHAMSMFNKKDVKRFVTFEQPVKHISRDGRKILQAIDGLFLRVGGRPHWGLNNFLNESRVQNLYGEQFDTYKRVRNNLLKGKPDIFKFPDFIDKTNKGSCASKTAVDLL